MSLARENKAHLMLVYHLGKGERTEASDGILGSTAFFAAVDTALITKRSKLYRTLQSRQRYGTDLPETILDFDPVSRKMGLGVEKSEADVRRVGQAVLDYLDGCGEPKMEVEVNSAVKGRNDVKRNAIRSLVEDGVVVRSGSGTKGEPFKYAKSSDSCPQNMDRTRVQESEKRAEPRTKTS
jgi:hypothetical protein